MHRPAPNPRPPERVGLRADARIRFGLRARLVAVLVGLVVTAMGAATATSVAAEAESRQKAAETQLAHAAMLLALPSPLLANAPGEEPWRRYQETLQRAERIRLTPYGSVFEMAYAAAFDGAAEVRARTINRRVLDLRLADGTAPMVTTRRLTAALIAVLERDHHGLLIVRVERRGGPLLEVGYSRTQISAEVRAMAVRAVALTLAFAALAALLGHFLASRLARPIELLAGAMRRVAGGDLSAGVTIERSDEVGVLAVAFNQMLEGLHERERIRDRFGRYVSPDVVAKILSDPERVSIAGERREVAVLFVDIRGFTTLAESLAPDDVVELVNGVFAAVWGPVSRWGGTIDKFLGDGVMILFNAPLDQHGFALAAARAATEIQAAVQELSTARGRQGKRGIDIGCGLNIAEVVAGSFGTAERMEYTVVGDGVNVAARLEDLAASGETLISEPARAAIGPEAVVEDAGRRVLKGKLEPQQVWRLVAVG